MHNTLGDQENARTAIEAARVLAVMDAIRLLRILVVTGCTVSMIAVFTSFYILLNP